MRLLGHNKNVDAVKMIYPNPVHDHLVIDLDNIYSLGDRVDFELFDMTGKKVMQRELVGQRSEISLLSYGLSEGLYLYQINFQSGKNRMISGKLIVK